jgi:hypothetical protein
VRNLLSLSFRPSWPFLIAISGTFIQQFYLLYGSGYCCNRWCCNRGEPMFWRIVISVAVVEALLCVLPIEFAGVMAVIRLLLGQ